MWRQRAAIATVEGVQRDLKMGEGVINHGESFSHFHINRQLLAQLALEASNEGFFIFDLAAGEFPQAAQQTIQWALRD